MISWIERTDKLSSRSGGNEKTLNVLWVDDEAKDISEMPYVAYWYGGVSR